MASGWWRLETGPRELAGAPPARPYGFHARGLCVSIQDQARAWDGGPKAVVAAAMLVIATLSSATVVSAWPGRARRDREGERPRCRPARPGRDRPCAEGRGSTVSSSGRAAFRTESGRPRCSAGEYASQCGAGLAGAARLAKRCDELGQDAQVGHGLDRRDDVVR
jgi:hypothetical protein